jgi:hypothetical protein
MEWGLSNWQGRIARGLRVGSAGGAQRLSSTSGSRLICGGLVPHDRVCEMRSGAVCLAASVPGWAAHSGLSGRSSRRCAGALSPPSR